MGNLDFDAVCNHCGRAMSSGTSGSGDRDAWCVNRACAAYALLQHPNPHQFGDDTTSSLTDFVQIAPSQENPDAN